LQVRENKSRTVAAKIANGRLAMMKIIGMRESQTAWDLPAKTAKHAAEIANGRLAMMNPHPPNCSHEGIPHEGEELFP
jgi:hypothetical protein